ncbi:MAG: hypothetical protein LBL75_00410 [Rickettsiales bacterium]|jgi:hypothetical protein|nr:hypothetical protein [Rickettsiales bacterium]
MKNIKNIFNGRFLIACFAMCFCVITGSFANVCDENNADYIDPSFVLCSTHAYNTGNKFNPTDTEGREIMNSAIALKTTLISQQMKLQYDFLKSTIKRIQTQMEKAVLMASLEKAGADTDGGSLSSSATLAGIRNCDNVSTDPQVLECLRENYNILVQNQSGNKTAVRKQLEKDIDIFVGTNKPKPSACTGLTNAEVSNCLVAYTRALRNAQSEIDSKKNNQQRIMPGQ